MTTPEYRFNPARLIRIIFVILVVIGGVGAWVYFARGDDGGDANVTNIATPILPVATETPAPSSTPPPTATMQGGRPPATTPRATAAPSPTGRPASPTPTATARPSPTPASRGPLVTVAYDSFPSYHTWAYAARKGYAPGIDLQAKGFGMEEDNPPESEKFGRLRSGRYQVLVTTLDS